MSAARRGRKIGAIAVSAVIHAVLLTAVALHAPSLFIPHESRGPPEPIIPILLMPRTPPAPRAAGVAPAPIRLHRRQLRYAPKELPVPPLHVPEPKTQPASPAPPVFRPAPLPRGGQKEELRLTLRRSAIGCANPEAAGLSREEREACAEQLGQGAGAAPFRGLGLPAGKQGALERAGARKEAERRYKEAPPPAGLSQGGPGATAEDLGRSLGNDRPKASAPF
ncbi:flagellar biosynthesis protein FlhF [Phenylobacterium soli]|uniref:Uncharacterized protein n=1 Tax=Phenylobacterium soli TaxID=2170551 RepID=A0A328AJE5_9CAUL|nr:hypothetical protein [Phenylobacterium soli]RAK55063.1 hypothetical protein DJ017_11310 [Phenylobacterium soli]